MKWKIMKLRWFCSLQYCSKWFRIQKFLNKSTTEKSPTTEAVQSNQFNSAFSQSVSNFISIALCFLLRFFHLSFQASFLLELLHRVQSIEWGLFSLLLFLIFIKAMSMLVEGNKIELRTDIYGESMFPSPTPIKRSLANRRERDSRNYDYEDVLSLVAKS